MQATLEQAVALIKAGDIEKGKQLLADVIRQNPRDENAWLWMTRCVATTEQKKYCFEKVLQINPQNQHAINGLNRLNIPAPPKPPTQPKAVPQQPAPQPKTKKSNPLIIILALIGLGTVCVCAFFFLGSLASPSSDENSFSAPSSGNERVYSLELLATNDAREYDFITIEGQVKNISGTSLEDVEAVVQFFDANGNFVKSDSALIDYNPILAGQTSPFTVITTDNPEIKKYSVSFKFLLGGSISMKDSRK